MLKDRMKVFFDKRQNANVFQEDKVLVLGDVNNKEAIKSVEEYTVLPNRQIQVSTIYRDLEDENADLTIEERKKLELAQETSKKIYNLDEFMEFLRDPKIHNYNKKDIEEIENTINDMINLMDLEEQICDIVQKAQSDTKAYTPNARSSNKIDYKKKDIYDLMYDESDRRALLRADFREMGVPFDFELDDDIKMIAYAGLSSIATGAVGFCTHFIDSGIMQAVFGEVGLHIPEIMMFAGITGWISAAIFGNIKDIRLRLWERKLQGLYLQANGRIKKERVQRLMGIKDKKNPDMYELALYTDEERYKILSQFEEAELTSKEKIKKLQAVISQLENEQYGYPFCTKNDELNR